MLVFLRYQVHKKLITKNLFLVGRCQKCTEPHSFNQKSPNFKINKLANYQFIHWKIMLKKRVIRFFN